MDCSIVLVSFNTRDLLLRSLESLHRDTSGYDIEIIVVDNASRDGSLQAVESRYPKVRCIPNSHNIGFARAANQGISAANGRNLMLLNPDALVETDTIGRLVEVLDSCPNVGAVGPLVVSSDGTPQHHCASQELSLIGQIAWHFRLPIAGLCLGKELGPHRARITERLSGAALAVRRDVIEAVGLLDERFFLFYEDADWTLRIRQAGFDAACVTEAFVTHSLGASSRDDPISRSTHAVTSELLYFEKHFGRTRALVLSYAVLASTALRAVSFDALRALDPAKRYRLREAWHVMRSCLCR